MYAESERAERFGCSASFSALSASHLKIAVGALLVERRPPLRDDPLFGHPLMAVVELDRDEELEQALGFFALPDDVRQRLPVHPHAE